jgi:two-component system nitrogen regulation sensor histidine kinase NtrY
MATNPQQAEQHSREMARRKRERIIIAVLIVLVAAVTYLETQVVDLSGDLPLGSSLLVFALININALLLLLLIFLVLRNLLKLTVERQRGVLGARLRTKLVVTFVILSLAPTILLFFAAFQFVGTSMEYWFSGQVERSLMEAMEVSQAYNKQIGSTAARFAGEVAGELEAKRWDVDKPSKAVTAFIESQRALFGLAAVRVFNADLGESAVVTQSGTHISHLQTFPLDLVRRVLTQGKALVHLQSAPTGDFVAAVHPINIGGSTKGAVAVFQLLPSGAMAKISGINKGLEELPPAKGVKQPIKTNQYITLSIVTLDHNLRGHLVRVPSGQDHHRADHGAGRGHPAHRGRRL